MENISISDLLAIVRVTDERLAGMQEYANRNKISGFGDDPLLSKWESLSKFNARAKTVIIEKITNIGYLLNNDRFCTGIKFRKRFPLA